MKILILHDYLTSYGGAERVLEEILELFPDATIYTSKYNPEIFPTNSVIRKRIVHEFILFKFLTNSKSFRTILSYFSYFAFLFVNTSKFDLVISNTSGPATWVLSAGNRIAYYHKIPSFDFYSKKNPIQFIFSKVNHHFISRLKLIITNSNFNKSNFERIFGIAEKNIQVVYPFISIKSLDLINKYSNVSKLDYFIYIGRLESYKRIQEIISACIKLNVNLKVIGEGTLSGRLPISDKIEYLGFVDDDTKFKLLSGAKGLISLGGDREEFGIIYLESILCKTPFVGMNSGGAVELSISSNSILIKDLTELDNAIVDLKNKSVSMEDVLEYKNKFSKVNFDKDILSITSQL